MGFMVNKIANLRQATIFSETPPFPRAMMLEATNACNLKCEFCLSALGHRENTYAKADFIKKTLTDAYNGGSREVCFNLNGEPLLHPKLAEFIEMAKTIGYEYIYLTTNGTLATRTRLEQLAESGLNSIKFSINAHNEEMYYKVHGLDKFRTVLENLEEAIKLRDKSKALDQGFYRVMATYVYTTPEITTEMKEFRARIGSKLDDFEFVKVHGITREIDGYCTVPFNRLYVSAEGYLSLCIDDSNNLMVVADLNNTDIISAWHCDLARQTRKLILADQLDGILCGHCRGVSKSQVAPVLNVKASKPLVWPNLDRR